MNWRIVCFEGPHKAYQVCPRHSVGGWIRTGAIAKVIAVRSVDYSRIGFRSVDNAMGDRGMGGMR